MASGIQPSAKRTSPVFNFAYGFRCFFSGLRLLSKNSNLWGLSLLPIVITMLALGFFALGSAWAVGSLLERSTSSWVHYLRYVAQALAFILSLFLGYLIYLPLARMFLAPFNEALSRRTDTIIAGFPAADPAMGWVRAIVEAAKLVFFQLALTVIVLALGFFIPPVGAIAGVSIGVFFCSVDYMDVPLSVRGLSLGAKLRFIWRYKTLALGFGTAGYVLLLIPFVNLLSLPVGIIAATSLVYELNQHETNLEKSKKSLPPL